MRDMLIILMVVCLSGCATFGNVQITDREIVSQIQKGETTKEGVKSLLGTPGKVTFQPNGKEVWDYVYSKARPKPSTFIPIVGLFTGGPRIQTYTLTILFDNNGIVEAVGGGETKYEGGYTPK